MDADDAEKRLAMVRSALAQAQDALKLTSSPGSDLLRTKAAEIHERTNRWPALTRLEQAALVNEALAIVLGVSRVRRGDTTE